MAFYLITNVWKSDCSVILTVRSAGIYDLAQVEIDHHGRHFVKLHNFNKAIYSQLN